MQRGKFFKLLLGGGAGAIAPTVPEATEDPEVFVPIDWPDSPVWPHQLISGNPHGTPFSIYYNGKPGVNFKWAKDGSMWVERDGETKKLI